jgi:hypothetical protein
MRLKLTGPALLRNSFVIVIFDFLEEPARSGAWSKKGRGIVGLEANAYADIGK